MPLCGYYSLLNIGSIGAAASCPHILATSAPTERGFPPPWTDCAAIDILTAAALPLGRGFPPPCTEAEADIAIREASATEARTRFSMDTPMRRSALIKSLISNSALLNQQNANVLTFCLGFRATNFSSRFNQALMS
jgi:hypothetical protein